MNQKRWVIGLFLAAVLAIGIGTASAVVVYRSQNSYEHYMELAQKYLLEEEYEAAIAAYEKAIALEPKEKDAYQELAEVYIEKEDFELAIEVLEQGYKETKARSLERKIEKTKGLLEPESVLTAQEILENYYEQISTESKKPIDYNKSYIVAYEAVEDAGYAVNGYLEEIEGCVAYDIRDYDKDGQEELLVLTVQPSSDMQEMYSSIWFQMYEITQEAVELAAQTEAYQGILGGSDIQDSYFYVKQTGDMIYLAEESTETVCTYADGTTEALRILHYDGSCFVTDTEKSYSGSDFSGMEEIIAQTADEIRSYGFTKSADGLDTSLTLQMEDGMEELLLVTGVNYEIYNPYNRIGTYWENHDLSVLGEVTYRFYTSWEQYREQKKITGYHTQTQDYGISEDGTTIHASFERVVLEGANPDEIAWINKISERLEEEYAASLADIDEWFAQLKENPYDEQWAYHPYSVDSVYYNEQGAVSISYSWDWYMGGVANGGWESLNYNVYDHSSITLEEAIGVDWEEAYDMVKQELASEHGFTANELENSSGFYNPSFWFDEDFVYVGYESYALNQGGWPVSIMLPRN